MTEVRELCFSYGRRKIVDGLSFQLEPGECLVLAGPNGSGKSTVLALLAGVLRPRSGEIRRGGKVGYVPQGSALFEDLSAEDNLRFFAGLAHCAVPGELPFSLNEHRRTRVSRMSGGMKRQLSIACALLGQPEILLLDEPCAGLDLVYREELIALVQGWKAQGRTVIYAGHEPLEFADFADHVLFMGGGQYSREQLAGESGDFAAGFSRVFREQKRSATR